MRIGPEGLLDCMVTGLPASAAPETWVDELRSELGGPLPVCLDLGGHAWRQPWGWVPMSECLPLLSGVKVLRMTPPAKGGVSVSYCPICQAWTFQHNAYMPDGSVWEWVGCAVDLGHSLRLFQAVQAKFMYAAPEPL